MAEAVHPEETLTGDEALLAALLSGSKLVDAAKAGGMSERTARRRLADPAFRGRLDDGRRELVGLVVSRLGSLADKAVDTLDELLDEPTPAPQRLGSARESLRHLSTFAELADSRELAERLAALERRLGLAAVEEDAA